MNDPRCTDHTSPNGVVTRSFGPVWTIQEWNEDGSIRYFLSHKQVEVKPNLSVDAGMVKLLAEAWRLNIGTVYSCQGDYEAEAYIMFASGPDLETFLSVIGDRGYEVTDRAVYFPPEDIPLIEGLLAASLTILTA
jgi:hypothetical protein